MGDVTRLAQEYLGQKETVVPNDVGAMSKTIRQKALIYGPIDSRRLGRSLGINMVKGGWFCNFRCVYCQYIAEDNQRKETGKGKEAEWVTVEEVYVSLEVWLRENQHERLDAITFSGNTDPLLNPHFNAILRVVLELRDKYRPGVKVALFTNAAKLKGINLEKIDVVFLKFDAGNQETFDRINQTGMQLLDLVDEIISAKPQRKNLQTMLVGGADGNMGEKDIHDFIELLKKIAPNELGLYSILYTVQSGYHIRVVTDAELNTLAERIRKEVPSIEVTVFGNDPVLGLPRTF